MNLKKCLEELCDIRGEIKELERRIEKLDKQIAEGVTDFVESTTKTFPIIRTYCSISGPEAKRVKRLEYYRTLLEQRYDYLLQIQLQVEEYIDQLPTSRLRRIFTFRYIDQYSWIKIAQLIGGDSTPESVRKEHDRSLKKNKVCPICPENV